MAVSVYVEKVGNEPESYLVAFDSEVRSLWTPVINRRELHHLGYIVSACDWIDENNYEDIKAEVGVMLQELYARCEYEEDERNPVFRCKRLLDIIGRFNNDASLHISIG